MKTSSLLTYAGLLLLGLGLGWWLFGGNQEASDTAEPASVQAQMWTCSMHPQIMQPEPGDCPLCGMDLIKADTGAEGLRPEQFKLTPRAMALANIQTQVVGEPGSTPQRLELSGKIAENEKANAVQVSYFAGRIERLYVNATGEGVKKGQLLAQVYAPDLYAAQQELITASQMKEQQPALYQAVRKKLRLWKISDAQIARIEKSGEVQAAFPVYANVTGTLTQKLVEQGDYVAQGEPLFKIANLNTVWANFDVYEHQISQLAPGQSIRVQAASYPDKSFEAKVDFIDPLLNADTRTLNLRVVLDNTEGLFKPGMFVTAELEQASNATAQLQIPASAVLWTGERSVVYLKVQPDAPIFEMQEVQLGTKIGDTYTLLDGLQAGDELVTHGTFTLDAAAQLQAKPSMMNRQKSEQAHHRQTDEGLSLSFNPNTHRWEAPEAFTSKLQQAYTVYLALKNALVESEPTQAQQAALQLYKETQNLASPKLSDSAQATWEKLYPGMLETAKSISQSESLDQQRQDFIALSLYWIQALQAFALPTPTYVAYCPMADSDQGAYWLSAEPGIRNPYFGAAMLKCGEVKQTLNSINTP
jgi:Cu(I)/Ag(I) efflux system membrane fusion protein